MHLSITDRGPVTRGGSLLPNERIREYLDRDGLRLDADLVRTIHGFDTLLVLTGLTGATASANLQFSRFIRSRRATSRSLGESRAVSPILISPPRS